MGNSKGFTLLEILIVIMIMAILTVLSSQTIQQGIQSKVKIQKINDETSKLRDALKIIEKDINLIFVHQDLEAEMLNLIKQNKMKLQKPQAGASPPAVNPPSGVGYPCPDGNQDPLCVQTPNRISPRTGFVGKSEEIAFLTLNASRLFESGQQADFVKVGYSVRGCKKQNEESGGTQCLMRRESTQVEGDLSKGGEEIVLLENVSEFKLRYYGMGKQDWSTDWTFNVNDPKSKFPDAVEVSLSVKPDPKKDALTGQMVIPIRFANPPDERAVR